MCCAGLNRCQCPWPQITRPLHKKKALGCCCCSISSKVKQFTSYLPFYLAHCTNSPTFLSLHDSFNSQQHPFSTDSSIYLTSVPIVLIITHWLISFLTSFALWKLVKDLSFSLFSGLHLSFLSLGFFLSLFQASAASKPVCICFLWQEFG